MRISNQFSGRSTAPDLGVLGKENRKIKRKGSANIADCGIVYKREKPNRIQEQEKSA